MESIKSKIISEILKTALINQPSQSPEIMSYRERMISTIESRCGTMSSIPYHLISVEDLERLYAGCVRQDPKTNEGKPK